MTALPVPALVTDLAALGVAPGVAIARLAETFARAVGHTLNDCGLRLFSETEVEPLVLGARFDPASGPDVLGEIYQRLLAASVRHQGGVHYTPRAVADGLVAAAVEGWQPGSARLCFLDPSVGGGAFLLAVARWRKTSTDLSCRDICTELQGRDVDEEALAVAEVALALWCAVSGERPAGVPGLQIGDVFEDELPAADLVVGNPPFLSQLDASTAQGAKTRDRMRSRYGVALGPYADAASVFLLAGLNALGDNGRMVLIQPVSFLASRDVTAVREQLAPSLRGLWFSELLLFEASVRVCAPVVSKSDDPVELIARWVDGEVTGTTPVPRPAGSSWGPLVADLVGVPVPTLHLRPESPKTIGDLATATAGFRDQFYGFVPVVCEQKDDTASPAAAHPRLTTTGMIDPLRNRWGEREFRFAKQPWRRPIVALADLAAADERLARWTADRLRPKVVMATQTKVIEVAVDAHGTWIPATPLVSIEPRLSDDAAYDPDLLWRLAAALSAPALSAHALAEAMGAALTVQALKISARQVLTFGLPADAGAWDAGVDAAKGAAAAETAAAWRLAMMTLGEAMTAAYGTDETVLGWWAHRLPRFDR